MPSTRFEKDSKGQREWLCFRVSCQRSGDITDGWALMNVWPSEEAEEESEKRKLTGTLCLSLVYIHRHVYFETRKYYHMSLGTSTDSEILAESVVWLVCSSLLVAIFLTDLNVYQSRALGFFLDSVYTTYLHSMLIFQSLITSRFRKLLK